MRTARGFGGFFVVSALFLAGLWLLPLPASAGTGAYDLNLLLNEPHPFLAGARSDQSASEPVAESQIRAPARVPPGATPPMAGRSAASPAADDIRPPVAAIAQAAPPPERRTGAGILSEVRIGALLHDTGPFGATEEDGIDANLEILFTSPSFLRFIWSPRPHIGGNINSDGDTSQAYIGLTWEWTLWRGLFAGFSLGGAWHDGELKTNAVDRKELGCRVLFRESLEAGWRFADRHSLSVYLDHISNARLCSRNEGLDNSGVRYGYRF